MNHLAISLTDWLPGVITAVFSGGTVGAIVALLKVKPEAGQIVVTTAERSLIVQTGVMENMAKEIERLNKELKEVKEELNKRNDEIDDLRHQLRLIQGNQQRHDKEIQNLGNGKSP